MRGLKAWSITLGSKIYWYIFWIPSPLAGCWLLFSLTRKKKKQLRKDKFPLTQSVRVWSIQSRISWEHKPMHPQSQGADRNGCCAQLTFSFWFSPEPLSMAWCLPYFRVGIPPQWNLSRNTSQIPLEMTLKAVPNMISRRSHMRLFVSVLMSTIFQSVRKFRNCSRIAETWVCATGQVSEGVRSLWARGHHCSQHTW